MSPTPSPAAGGGRTYLRRRDKREDGSPTGQLVGPKGSAYSFRHVVVGDDWQEISAPANLGLVGRTVSATHGAQFVVGAYPGDDAELENLIVQDTGEKLLIRQSASDWNDQLTRTVTLYMDPDLGPSLRLENFE